MYTFSFLRAFVFVSYLSYSQIKEEILSLLLMFIYFLKFLYFILYLREREREREGEGQRDGDRSWSRLQALSCEHRARCGAWTNEQWDRNLSRSWTLNRLSHPGTPTYVFMDFLLTFKSLIHQDIFRWKEQGGVPNAALPPLLTYPGMLVQYHFPDNPSFLFLEVPPWLYTKF